MVERGNISGWVSEVQSNINKLVKNVWDDVGKEIESGNNEVFQEFLRGKTELYKEMEGGEKKFHELYENVIKLRETNYDKEIKKLEEYYNKMIKAAYDNKDLMIKLEKEKQTEIDRLKKTRAAVLTPEEIAAQEKSKVSEKLMGIAGVTEFKGTPASVGDFIGKLTSSLGVNLGVAGEAGGLMTKTLGSIATKLGAAGLIAGVLIGGVALWKKIEAHNREIQFNTRQIAVQSGLGVEGFTPRDYLTIVKATQSLFAMKRSEATKMVMDVFSVAGLSMEGYAGLMEEVFRGQKELGLSLGDMTSILRPLLGAGEGVGAVGVIYDVMQEFNKQWRMEGLHFTTKELQKSFNDLYKTSYLYGYGVENNLRTMTTFRETVDKGIFSYKELMDLELKFAGMEAEKLGGYIEWGKQLGALSGLTGDMYDQMWSVRKGGEYGLDMLNVTMSGVESMVSSMGYGLEKYELTSEILKDFGMSFKPMQVEELVRIWRESGGDFELLSGDTKKIWSVAKEQHEEELGSFKEFYNESFGKLSKLTIDVGNIAENMSDMVGYNKVMAGKIRNN